MFGVHCMAHTTNLLVLPLSSLPLVYKFEALCQAMFCYFNHSLQKHQEFQMLCEVLETECLSILRNFKIQWMNRLERLKCILGDYKTLVVNMCEGSNMKDGTFTYIEHADHIHDFLYNAGTLIALPCIVPLLNLLEFVNSLMKFAQSSHVIVSDYVVVVKICYAQLHIMYINPETTFSKQHY